MNAKECPIKGCLGKLLCGALPVFIFLFAAGFLIHHVWLMPIYQQTASLWRPMEQLEGMMPLMLLYYALLSLSITGLFCKASKGHPCDVSDPECKIGGSKCPIKFGICFGALVGLLMGTHCAGSYIWTPIPGELAVKWFIASLIQGIGAGVILSLLRYLQ